MPEKFTSFVIQSSVFEDIRTKDLIRQFGGESFACYLALQDQLYRRETHRLPVKYWATHCADWGISEPSDLLKHLEAEGFIRLDGTEIAIDEIDERIKVRTDERNKWRSKKKGQRMAPGRPPVVPVASPETKEGQCVEMQGDCPTHSHTHIDIKKNGVPPYAPIKSTDPPNDKRALYTKLAEEQLVKEGLDQDSTFMTTGKRCMIKFPLIRLTETELADILMQYEEDGVPIDKRKLYSRAFKAVQARLEAKTAQNQSIQSISAYSWLIGWAKSELVKGLRESNDLKRSAKYLNGKDPPRVQPKAWKGHGDRSSEPVKILIEKSLGVSDANN